MAPASRKKARGLRGDGPAPDAIFDASRPATDGDGLQPWAQQPIVALLNCHVHWTFAPAWIWSPDGSAGIGWDFIFLSGAVP